MRCVLSCSATELILSQSLPPYIYHPSIFQPSPRGNLSEGLIRTGQCVTHKRGADVRVRVVSEGVINFYMKRYIIIFLDVILAAYLGFAVTSFNNPKELAPVCTKVVIDIADKNDNGFLDKKEIKRILERHKLYPEGKRMADVSPRRIEELLKVSDFVKTAECYKTTSGHVIISVTQRTPVVRIKSQNGDDYYIDEKGGIMPNSSYTSDLIVVTGNVSKSFARQYITHLANTLMLSDFWQYQIEQINVQDDLGIELIPRVGDHVIFLGFLPEGKTPDERRQQISEYTLHNLDRLDKFYRHGLSQAGWNKYERIDLQFGNQIICRRRPDKTQHADQLTAQQHEDLNNNIVGDLTSKPAEAAENTATVATGSNNAAATANKAAATVPDGSPSGHTQKSKPNKP